MSSLNLNNKGYAMSVTFKGSPASFVGKQLNVGDNAPQVSLTDKDLNPIVVGGAQGKKQIISVVPSLDTGVCQVQAKRFNKEVASLQNTVVYVVSMDLPFGAKRFCEVEDVHNVVVASDFTDKNFGKEYGLLLANTPLKGLLTRAVIVVDTNGKIVYQEICSEITNEPDYQSALNAAKSV